MSLHESAVNIVEYVGGEGNIQTFSHCATRLRFTLADDKLVKEDKLKETKGVLGIVNKGGQYQVVIGPTVEKMYNEITPLLKKISNGNVDVKAQEKEKTKFDVVMSYISGAISPVLPVLIGAGMINAVLAIANLMGLAKDSGTYQAWAQIANIGFTYLPVFVAFSAARKLRTNEYIAAMISLAMIVCFNQQDGLSVFSAAIPNIKFANSIIPVLMMVPVMKIVDDLCNKVIPAAAHFTIKPLILLGIMAPFTLFVFGPIGAFVGGT
ncbi:MAG: PTS transporter subunit EIIB, partial [Butyrivibrio sp.]|nr:PTS transporter subunit EIIB [Butyrivibrio sp.]